MHHVAVAVAQDLHLDVASTLHQLLEVHLVVAKGSQCLAPSRRQRIRQFRFAADNTHAATATAPTGLEHHWVADASRQLLALFQVQRQWRRGRHHRHVGGHGGIARRNLVAQCAHHLGTWSDPLDAGSDHGFGKFWVLGEEAVSRVDGIHLGSAGDAQDVVDVEVGLQRFLALAHQVALIGLEAVERELVFLGIDRNGFLAHLVGGAHDANGDLAAVGNENFIEHSTSPGVLFHVLVSVLLLIHALQSVRIPNHRWL